MLYLCLSLSSQKCYGIDLVRGGGNQRAVCWFSSATRLLWAAGSHSHPGAQAKDLEAPPCYHQPPLLPPPSVRPAGPCQCVPSVLGRTLGQFSFSFCRCRSRPQSLSRGCSRASAPLPESHAVPTRTGREHVTVAQPSRCSQRQCAERPGSHHRLNENQPWRVMGLRALEFSMTFEEGILFEIKSLFKRSEGL